MKRPSASAFPELQKFFGGYLHEDFVEMHATPEGALRAFEADASDAERRRFRSEVARLRELVESAKLDDVRALLQELGAKWVPRSRADLTKWLSEAVGDAE